LQEAGQYLVAAEALLHGHSAELRKHGRHGWAETNDRRVEVHIAKVCAFNTRYCEPSGTRETRCSNKRAPDHVCREVSVMKRSSA
jgi:hypothetical protein